MTLGVVVFFAAAFFAGAFAADLAGVAFFIIPFFNGGVGVAFVVFFAGFAFDLLAVLPTGFAADFFDVVDAFARADVEADFLVEAAELFAELFFADPDDELAFPGDLAFNLSVDLPDAFAAGFAGVFFFVAITDLHEKN